MKKAVCLALALLVCLAGCGNESDEAARQPDTVNSLTGKALADGETYGNRVFAFMVNNSPFSMPQSGLNAADIIMEIPTEGGITRMIALFSDIEGVEKVGSLRGARPQLLYPIAQLNPVVVMVGDSSNMDFNAMGGDLTVVNMLEDDSAFFTDFDRLSSYAIENCRYSGATKLRECLGEKAVSSGACAVFFNFGRPSFAQSDCAKEIAFPFWDFTAHGMSYASENIDRGGTFTYDEAEAKYLKHQFGSLQTDETTGAPLAFDNVLCSTPRYRRAPSPTALLSA